MTKSGDVYSYGILLLEMFTRKRPIDDMFKDGFTLLDFTRRALPENVHQIVDPLLLHEANLEGGEASTSKNPMPSRSKGEKTQDCLISILSIGLACSAESPKDRIDITDAANELHSVRQKILQKELRATR